jgi:MYXO-CTERM domain-containing protein
MVTAATALITSRANADEHRTRVNEIFLSDVLEGDAAQFVELYDPMREEFPEDTYHLGIYDTAGALLDVVPVDPPAGTLRYLVATRAAERLFGVRADAPLAAVLPTEGQVCFEVTEEGENEVISCLAYGCVETLIEAEFANETGMAPFAGKSIQRQIIDRNFEIADPTPDRANMAGISGEPDCAPPPGDDDDDDDNGEPPPDDQPPPDMEEEPPPDTDDGGCQVASTGSSSGLALVAVGLLAVRRRRRRRQPGD